MILNGLLRIGCVEAIGKQKLKLGKHWVLLIYRCEYCEVYVVQNQLITQISFYCDHPYKQ